MILLAVAIIVSLLRGFDYRAAIYLAIVFAALAPCRPHFYRKSSLLAERFSPQWTVAVLLVMTCVLGLALFAYQQRLLDSNVMQFELNRNAPRSKRALLGAMVAIFAITLAHLLRAMH